MHHLRAACNIVKQQTTREDITILPTYPLTNRPVLKFMVGCYSILLDAVFTMIHSLYPYLSRGTASSIT